MGAHNKLFVVADDTQHASINITAFNDEALSYKAKGIHAYIRTRPHGTVTSMPDLLMGSVDGVHAIRSGIKELVKAKYLYLAQLRDSFGRISSVVYISFPAPVKIKQSELLKIIKNCGNYPLSENHHVDENRDSKRGKNCGNYPLSENHHVDGPINYNLNNINSPKGELNYPNYNTRPGLRRTRGLHQKTKSSDKQLIRAERLFDFWNSLPNTPTHKKTKTTKTYKLAIQALSKAVKRHPTTTIQSAMRAYDQLLSTPNTVIHGNGAPFRVGLDQFFHFSGYVDSLRRRDGHPLAKIKNWFAECTKGDAYLVDAYSKIRRDPNPRLTEVLTAAVLRDPMFDVTKLTSPQQNTIIQAGCKFRAFLDTHAAAFQTYGHLASKSLESVCVDRLFEYLRGVKKQLHLGYLVSDITWGNLGARMTEVGVLAPKSQSSGFRSIRDGARS